MTQRLVEEAASCGPDYNIPDNSDPADYQPSYREIKRARANDWLATEMEQLRRRFGERFPQQGLSQDRPAVYNKRPDNASRNWEVNLMGDMLNNAAMLEWSAQRLADYVNVRLAQWRISVKAIDSNPLRGNTVQNVARLLKQRGKTLNLRTHNTLNKIKLALRNCDSSAKGTPVDLPESITATPEIIYRDGKPYKRHPAGRGKTRIKHGNGFIPAEALIDFLSG